MDPLDKALGEALDAQLKDKPTEVVDEPTGDQPVIETPAGDDQATSGKDDTGSSSEDPGESAEKSAARAAAAAKRARDEAGRFKPKDGEQQQQPSQPTAAGPQGEQKPATGSATQQPAEPQPEVIEGRDITKPPSTWKAEAATDFAKLPRAVRAEIHRREESMFKGIEQYKTAAKFGTDLANEFRPYKQMLDATRLVPTDIVKAALSFEYHIRTGSPEQKRALIENLAKSYNVELAPAQPQTDEQGNVIQPSAEVVELRNTVNQLQQHISTITGELNRRATAEAEALAEEENAARSEVQNEISKFASDPANEFYNDVRAEMVSYIKSGQASGLKDAYDKAIWANPVTRQKLIDRRREAEQREAAEKAAAAKKANAVNVTPRTTPQGKTAGKGTLDNVLMANVEKAMARSA